MYDRYSGAEMEDAALRLIDAIPEEGAACQPFRSVYQRCQATGVSGFKKVAEDMVMWPGMAENLLDGYHGVPNYDGRGEGAERYTTEREHEVGACVLRRALGHCPVFEVNSD